MLHEKALSKKQQRFFGIVRAAQKGTFKGETTPQVQRAAANMTKKDVKKFASTKHKGLPEKKVKKEETCGKGEYYCNDDQKCKPIPKGMKVKKDGFLVKELNIGEGSLHKWFKGSKSKDGKGGWVNVVTGGTCASDEPGEGTPKCVSSSKRASMSKAERLSAARRKKKADPNQQSKSGAAKPTYVSTDKPKKKMKESFATDKYKEMAKREADLKRKEDLKVKTKKESVDIDEAKYEKGASTYGKASIRNKRMFGKGGNAAPPEERGAAIKVRRARHQERRYVKKGNKYHEPGKHRPEVYGVNKPEEERKNKNVKEGTAYGLYKGDGKVKFKLNKPEKKKEKEKELKEYSPNVSYQAKGGKKSGKLSKSSVYSLRRKDESKKDFRKSHTKDIKDGLMKKESVFTPLVFTVSEAKIDKIDPKNKRNRRNVAKFGPQTKPYDPPTKEMKTSMGKFMQKTRQDMHKKKRGVKQEEVVLESDKKGKGSGKKDACYHKVKASAKVWPSAYASGRLVQCRKKGAANYGNSKKESYGNMTFSDFMDECWKTHKKVGMKMKGGKMVPDCRPKNEEVTQEGVLSKFRPKKKEKVERKPQKAMDAGARGRRLLQRREYKAKVSDFIPKELEDHVVYENPNTNLFPAGTQQKVKKVLDAGSNFMKNNKVGRVLGRIFGPSNPNNKGSNYTPNGKIANSYEPEGQMLEGSAAWQKKSGKNSKGGLNEKGRKSYEAQNPGSDLKAPVTGKVKKGGKAAKRRKSFCARMGGMKGPMKKPNGEPTRKALALRKWKC